MDESQSYLDTALAAARVGGKILLENAGNLERRRASQKRRHDFVTQVDVLAEKAIVELIRQRHPAHQILAEESGGNLPENDYVWIIDPLDGTKNYIHGFPMSAVSVALKWGEELLVGAVLDPYRQELFYAEKGEGAFLNGQPVQVSARTDFSECLLATGFPFRARQHTEVYFDAFVSLFHKISDFRRGGAAALDLAYVACGRLDGFWEIGLNPWDVAAGTLLVQEAGGRVSDLFDGDTHLASGNIVASNGAIHRQIIDVLSRAFAHFRTGENSGS